MRCHGSGANTTDHYVVYPTTLESLSATERGNGARARNETSSHALAYSPTRVAGTTVRVGRNVEVRSLGGGAGCLTMIVVSLLASVLLTVLLNLVLR